ncbi:DegT/DnrJ/EryC1/StrS family aminotransferase [Xylanibacillus composti]|uniref:Aminotransferase DegT n=1 Tax=Xylanibacillus composti TaxID=1572762 RepID=A0A8J4M1H3_9BACL|nr:DegT/DnrJ/EryC1/StrS family aminotransferase [Xylanibacillus composti]MDT9727123.1 DegT/DnrJ/EryC1/StrS family aminotransferase [Xylanibacillus composti]GIQ68865.1 aminotransferase DegT [Xylanibacillus composti]
MAMSIKQQGWPRWPIADEETLEQLRLVLESGRWAISGPYTGEPTREQQFAEQFAAYNGVRWCVTLDHGTSALIAALEALDIGAGDEVIVPGLTWVAPALAVISVNAVPVFADVERDTLCMDVHAVEQVMTKRTRAILAVHMYGNMTDMDAMQALAEKHGLYLIEDAAHSHGASWNGRMAGSLGHIGVFSMQQGKVLTCGEGGAAITDEDELKDRLEASAWNARTRIAPSEQLLFPMSLDEGMPRFGTNRCLSEFQAAVLLDQLPRLDRQNRMREAHAGWLDHQCSQIQGVQVMRKDPRIKQRTYYGYVLQLDPQECPISAHDLIAHLQQDLQMGDFLLHSAYKPLYRNPLFRPHPRRHAIGAAYMEALQRQSGPLANCEYAYANSIVFHHSILLADQAQLSRLVEALAFRITGK